jgi:SAM-dependent methyltransferase
LEVPVNIDKYYPENYMAFAQKIPVLKKLSFWKALNNPFRISRKYKQGKNHELEYLKPTGLMPGAHILDIGCGRGALICALYNFGFVHITGVDKFIPAEIDYGNGVKVLKKELPELPSNTYDLLMMHHVLEHVDGQIKELKECYRLLKKGGTLLVRVPVLGTAWNTYRENWVQLDAPRHFVLHTLKSMGILAANTGFKIEHSLFDSTGFQFWGSELYKKDIPLTDPLKRGWLAPEKIFIPAQIQKFEEDAVNLNKQQKGDAAMFYLRKQ